ncbi:MAG TPA: hypothetical protein PK299_05475 [Anaerolineales bacterium]|nr:hypothetical protein [Anaerolineales bacterium]
MQEKFPKQLLIFRASFWFYSFSMIVFVIVAYAIHLNLSILPVYPNNPVPIHGQTCPEGAIPEKTDSAESIYISEIEGFPYTSPRSVPLYDKFLSKAKTQGFLNAVVCLNGNLVDYKLQFYSPEFSLKWVLQEWVLAALAFALLVIIGFVLHPKNDGLFSFLISIGSTAILFSCGTRVTFWGVPGLATISFFAKTTTALSLLYFYFVVPKPILSIRWFYCYSVVAVFFTIFDFLYETTYSGWVLSLSLPLSLLIILIKSKKDRQSSRIYSRMILNLCLTLIPIGVILLVASVLRISLIFNIFSPLLLLILLVHPMIYIWVFSNEEAKFWYRYIDPALVNVSLGLIFTSFALLLWQTNTWSLIKSMALPLIALIGFQPSKKFLERFFLKKKYLSDEVINVNATTVARAKTYTELEIALKQVWITLDIRIGYCILQEKTAQTKYFLCENSPSNLNLDSISLGITHYNKHNSLADWLYVSISNEYPCGNLLFLLGDKPPDNYYSLEETKILTTIMAQVALAIQNINRAVEIQHQYEKLLQLQEKSRKVLAAEVHDSLLQEIRVLKKSTNDANILSGVTYFQDKLYSFLSRLQPPKLEFGLWTALDILTDELQKYSNGTFFYDIPQNEYRYPEIVEYHIFCMAREACENALHHAQAETIWVEGQLSPNQIQISIIDNGIGIAKSKLERADGFGIKNGFSIRANAIGAIFSIHSKVATEGTVVNIVWDSNTTSANFVVMQPNSLVS